MDTEVERPRWRFNAAYRLTPRVNVGIEYNPVVEELNPTVNWIVSPEGRNHPMVSFGTSSDRIFTPEGNQAYYVTFAKGVPGTKLAPYVSVNYSEFESGFNFPFGINIGLADTIDLLPMNDGRKSHLLLTFKQPKSNVTLMAVDLKRPRFGISFGWGF